MYQQLDPDAPAAQAARTVRAADTPTVRKPAARARARRERLGDEGRAANAARMRARRAKQRLAKREADGAHVLH
jgi:hypothetical protein